MGLWDGRGGFEIERIRKVHLNTKSETLHQRNLAPAAPPHHTRNHSPSSLETICLQN